MAAVQYIVDSSSVSDPPLLWLTEKSSLPLKKKKKSYNMNIRVCATVLEKEPIQYR